MKRSVCLNPLAACTLLGALVAAPARAQLSFYSAVDLARRNSTSVRLAQADVARAEGGLAEARDVYIPQLVVGSSVGYSYGFPVGQPTLFNAQAQSLVVSFSQPDYIRSARASLHTAVLRLTDAVDQVELDAALDYAQLSTIAQQVRALNEEHELAGRLASIEQSRVDAGVETRMSATRAQLTAAQSDLKRLDLIAQAAVVRERLANLTGLPASAIETAPESIPEAPQREDTSLRRTLASVDASYSNATSRSYQARGDERQSYRPQIGLGVNYQLFDTSVNNYNYYYLHPLQANNLSIGVQISLPLFDPLKRARAKESAADAIHAQLEAEQAREQADEQVLQLERSLATLEAQAHVADLQSKLAAEQVEAISLQVANPPAAPGAPALTPVDELEARMNERLRYSEALDARLTLLRARLGLLRSTRQLSSWVNHAAH